MNHQEFMFVLGGAGNLNSPMFDKLVIDKAITQAELASTREGLKDVVNTLKYTPSNKIEALVAEYGSELAKHFRKFSEETSTKSNFLAAFHDAQIMLGFLTSILAKARIRETHKA